MLGLGTLQSHTSSYGFIPEPMGGLKERLWARMWTGRKQWGLLTYGM